MATTDEQVNTGCADEQRAQAHRLRAIRDQWALYCIRQLALDEIERINADPANPYAHKQGCRCRGCRAVARRRNQRAVA